MAKLYEIIELPDGDIALQREGDTDGQPLVTMRFSMELLRFLRGEKLEIAKSMLEAGLEKVAEIAQAVESDSYFESAEEQTHFETKAESLALDTADFDTVEILKDELLAHELEVWAEHEEDYAYSSIPVSHLLH